MVQGKEAPKTKESKGVERKSLNLLYTETFDLHHHTYSTE